MNRASPSAAKTVFENENNAINRKLARILIELFLSLLIQLKAGVWWGKNFCNAAKVSQDIDIILTFEKKFFLVQS